MSRSRLALALALPLAVLAVGIVRAELHLSSARRFTFEVEGYDPRDLLHGHYLQYRLRLQRGKALQACDERTGQPCCYCIDARDEHTPPSLRLATCEIARARCTAYVQQRPLTALHRYYVPEASAAALTERLGRAARAGRAKLVVAVDARGKPQVESLWLDGKPIDGAAR